MEGSMSKKTRKVSPSVGGDQQYAKGLSSYKSACEFDVDLQKFDTKLLKQTSHVINTPACGVKVRAVWFDSLKEVTVYLQEMNQEVVNVILKCEDDMSKTPQLRELVDEYFDNSLQTLVFCNNLVECLQRVCDRRLPILAALRQFEEGTEVRGNRYVPTLEKLKIFKAEVDQLANEFLQMSQSIYEQLKQTSDKLRQRKKKLDKKLKCIRVGRKLLHMIFVTALAALLISSIAAAAMAAAPPVTEALTAASASIAIGSAVGKWVDSLWKNCENALKWQEEVISAMKTGNYAAERDLENIKLMIDALKFDITALLQSQDSIIEEELVKIGMEEIKKKLEDFIMNAKSLAKQVVLCRDHIMESRNMVVQKIVEKHNSYKKGRISRDNCR